MKSIISTKSVVASSDHRTVCTGFTALFEHGLNLRHSDIMCQARFFAAQGFLNLGTKPLVIASFLFFSFELGNNGRYLWTHALKISILRAYRQPKPAALMEALRSGLNLQLSNKLTQQDCDFKRKKVLGL
jgi:hypothetical protein